MIRRRSFIAGICSLFAAPSAVTALLTMLASARTRLEADLTTGPSAAPVVFRVNGWDHNDSEETKADQQVVVIHLTNSWRSAWL